MDNKREIKDLFGLEKPTTKLIEMVSGAIGTVYEPRRIKKLADAEAYRIKTLTNAAKEANFNGEIEFLDGKIKINSNDISNQEIKSLIVNEVKRLFNEKENIKKIADFAYNELKNDKKETNEEIDEDWKNNFFDKGRKIYTEDLQFIFGKILAGEIKQPGTYSKRLLGILSNLSQKETTIFTKIAKLSIKGKNNTFIISDKEILESFDIKLDEIILLEEAGLINSNELKLSGKNNYEYKNYLIDFLDTKPNFHVYLLTKSGCELENIVNNEINLEYLSKIKHKYNIPKMNYNSIISKTENEDHITYSISDIKEVD